jgi:LacI family transcriptional regulator
MKAFCVGLPGSVLCQPIGRSCLHFRVAAEVSSVPFSLTTIAHRADGMLISPCNHRQIEHVRRLRARSYPAVLLVGDPDACVDAECMDERAGALKAVSHPISDGLRRIALIYNAGENGNQEKLDGHKVALGAAGLKFDSDLFVVTRGDDVRSGYLAMETLASRSAWATAVFCATASLALGALRYCVKHAIAVPKDMAIFGFDNIEFADHAVIALSSVNYDNEAITRLAIDRMIALPAPIVTQVEPDLVIRESTSAHQAKI